jgi:hypothetical protein
MRELLHLAVCRQSRIVDNVKQDCSQVAIPSNHTKTNRAVVPLLFCWMVLSSLGAAQPVGLKVEVTDGEGAINNIRLHRARVPVVRVVDGDNAPVGNASVTFFLPDMGPSGEFPGEVRTLAVMTDDKGQAVGRGLVPNQVAGKYQIRVVASYRGEMATTLVNQINAEPGGAAKGGPSKKVLLIALIGGAAAGGAALAATHGGGGSSSSQSQPASSPPSSTGIVISSGTPVFQPPH